MNKEFDAALDAIATNHVTAVAQARRDAAAAQAATDKFNLAWQACRTAVVMPTLNEIAAKLTARQMGAHVGQVDVVGVALYLPGGPDARLGQHNHPTLKIRPQPHGGGSGSIVFTQNYGQGDGSESYTVENVTRELIEQESLKLVRRVYGKNER